MNIPTTATNKQKTSVPATNKVSGFNRFKSEMNATELEQLAASLSQDLGMEIDLAEIARAQDRLQGYVSEMKGRVGEGIDDLLVLWFVRRAAALSVMRAKRGAKRPPVVNSFEIGALFGGSGGASIMAVSDLKIDHRYVVIDPLDGYYGQPVDPVTGASVDAETLTENLELAGAREGELTILAGLSQDPQIIEQAGRLKYASGFIDGDHTMLGIHNDWFKYTPRILVGGYCIVDNYDDPTSLEVGHFVDGVILTELKDYWQPVTKLGQTIVLKKLKEVPKALHEDLSKSIPLSALQPNLTWLSHRAETAVKQADERRMQVRNRETKIEILQSDLKRLEAERDLMVAKAGESAREPLVSKLAELEKGSADRKAEIEGLNIKREADQVALAEAREEMGRLQADLASKESALNSAAKSEARLGAQAGILEANESQLRAQLDLSQEELRDLKSELGDKARDLAVLQAKFETLSASETTMRADLVASREQSSKLRGELHEQELEKARLDGRLELQAREIESTQGHVSELKRARDEIGQEAKELERKVATQDTLISELQHKVQQAAYEAEQLVEARANLAELESTLNQQAIENEKSQARDNESQKEIDRLKGELGRATQAVEDLEALDQLRLKERESLEKTIASEASEIDRLRGSMTAAQEQLKHNEQMLAAGANRIDASERRAEEASAREASFAKAAEQRIVQAEKRADQANARLAAIVADNAKQVSISEDRAEKAAKSSDESERRAEDANARAARASKEADSARAARDRAERERLELVRRADELQRKAHHLEARTGKLEAEATAPRVLFRRLAKSVVVRSLEIGASISPGAVKRALLRSAQSVRKISSAQQSQYRLPNSDLFELPAGISVANPSVPATPEAHPAGPAQHDLTYFVNYTFGGKTRYLPRAEFLQHTHRTAKALQKLKGKFKGQRCFVMGNGPSLNRQNLKQLTSEFTFGANYIYMNEEKMGFVPSIVSFSNFLVISQRLEEIVALDSQIALPFYLYDEVGAPDNAILLNMQHQTPSFSEDAAAFASTQSTVTYVNLQLAYYLGFDEIYLVGVDNRYVQPERGKEGTVLTQEDDDPNHFTPAYFKGLKWQKGDVDRIEELYSIAGGAFSARGSKVVDCTDDGALTVFEKDDLDRVLRRQPAPPSSLIVEAKRVLSEVGEKSEDLKPNRLSISVSPDLVDEFGHHLNMDSYLRACAISRGETFLSICSSKVDPELADKCNWLVPAFRAKTWWSIRDRSVIERKRREFATDMRKAMTVIDEGLGAETPATFYMYTGNLYLGLALRDALAYRKNTTIVIQDFYAPFFDLEDPAILEERRALLEELLSSGVRVAVGTKQLVDYVRQKTGLKLELIPGDPSTTYGDESVQQKIADDFEPIIPDGAKMRVFFPPNMNLEKGYLTGLKAAEVIAADDKLAATLSPIVRYVPREGTDRAALDLADKLRGKGGVEFAEGVLDDEQFRELAESADIVAIPYTVQAFRRRMSNSLTDAIYGGKPIVGAQGTYVGDYIEQYQCGQTFKDGNHIDLVRAISEVAADFERYARNSRIARRTHFKQRSWEAIHSAINAKLN